LIGLDRRKAGAIIALRHAWGKKRGGDTTSHCPFYKHVCDQLIAATHLFIGQMVDFCSMSIVWNTLVKIKLK
jgi:hypothetical protein